MKANKLILGLLIVFTMQFSRSFAQEQQALISEVKFQYGKLITKIRPVVYNLHNDVYRVDLMVGYQILKPWSFYIYWKNDTKDQHRLGIRTDFGYKFFDNKISTSIQYRYFWGMNEPTQNQYYIIPSITYNAPYVSMGVWCFSNKVIHSTAVGYLGPTAYIKFANWAYLFLSYTKDIYSTKHLLYVQMDFKVDFTKKTEIKN